MTRHVKRRSIIGDFTVTTTGLMSAVNCVVCTPIHSGPVARVPIIKRVVCLASGYIMSGKSIIIEPVESVDVSNVMCVWGRGRMWHK